MKLARNLSTEAMKRKRAHRLCSFVLARSRREVLPTGMRTSAYPLYLIFWRAGSGRAPWRRQTSSLHCMTGLYTWLRLPFFLAENFARSLIKERERAGGHAARSVEDGWDSAQCLISTVAVPRSPEEWELGPSGLYERNVCTRGNSSPRSSPHKLHCQQPLPPPSALAA